MGNNTTVRILRAFAGRWLDKAETDTKRSLRKMIEFGYCFSGSAGIRNFFHEARNIINSNRSQYFLLTRELVKNVDKIKTTEFGIIFGFEGLVKGMNGAPAHLSGNDCEYALAAVIDGTKDGSLSGEAELEARVSSLSQNGAALFFIFCDRAEIDGGTLKRIAESHPKKAFFIFTGSGDLAGSCSGNNVMPVLDLGSVTYPEISSGLRKQKQLFGGFVRYGDETAEAFTQSAFLDKTAESGCLFLFLAEDGACSQDCKDRMSAFSRAQKRKPTHPIFITDILGDLKWLNGTALNNKRQ